MTGGRANNYDWQFKWVKKFLSPGGGTIRLTRATTLSSQILGVFFGYFFYSDEDFFYPGLDMVKQLTPGIARHNRAHGSNVGCRLLFKVVPTPRGRRAD